MGHLGDRVSALLDGQLSQEEADRAWLHVHGCHACRDLVEREGWIKTRLSGLSRAEDGVPADLAGLLKGRLETSLAAPPGDALALAAPAGRSRRASLALAALGGGAAGAAVMGLLTLGAAPADAPTVQQQPPTVSIEGGTRLLPVTTVRRIAP